MSLKIKLTEKRLKRISKKIDKLDKDFYGTQRKLRDLYKKSIRKNIYDDDAVMEAEAAARSAWEDGIVIKEGK